MSQLHVACHIARADFLERVRRYSFLGTMAFAVYLAILVGKGDLFVSLGGWRGRFTSAWLGMLLTLIATTFVALAGFYMVSSSVKRDEQTRVGQILAATPMSRVSYTLGKMLSNFAVLSAMVAVLALAAIPLQLFAAEERHIDVVQLFAPFVVFALPMMALIAALAVFFEVTPVLRGSVGSVGYFFMWAFGLIACEMLTNLDLFGINSYVHALSAVVRGVDPSYKNDFGIQIKVDAHRVFSVFSWDHMNYPSSLLAGRVAWILGALALVLLSSSWFHRFDPARTRGLVLPRKKVLEVETVEPAATVAVAQLTPVRAQRSASWFGEMLLGELRVLMLRRHWSVYILALGLFILGCSVPLNGARRGVLAAVWILPVFAFSRVGARDDMFSTRALIYTGPNAATRQLLSSWISAALLPLLLSAGVAVRLLATGDVRGCAALIAGAMFVSALAHALGELTRSPKAFEAIYILWWYIGPLNHAPGCDFYGASAASARPDLYATIAAILLCSAWMLRQARMRLA